VIGPFSQLVAAVKVLNPELPSGHAEVPGVSGQPGSDHAVGGQASRKISSRVYASIFIGEHHEKRS
jgi:hypothetical protein